MALNQDFRKRIQTEEGIHIGKSGKPEYTTVYLDTKDLPTAGYGIRVPGKKPGEKLCKDWLDCAFEQHYGRALNNADQYLPNFETYEPQVQEVLTDMAFNMGAEGG